jgi:serine phosphatase RsbU (regulator of sigma subunit)
MNDVEHSRHWIAVHTPQEWLTIGVPERLHASVASSLAKVSRREEKLEEVFDGEFLVGHHSASDLEIFVAETYHEVQAGIWSDLSRHSWGVGLILLAGIVTLNLVMNAGFLSPLNSLAVAARAVGKGEFGSKIEAVGIRELDALAVAFNGMSDQLAEVERNRATQMHTARLIQEHLLPTSVSIAGFEVAYLFRPAEAIGGDYFDILPLKDGGSILAIADASGHGVPAALVAAIVKVLLLDAVEHISEPAEILRLVDKRINSLDIPEAFVTMQLVRLLPGTDYIDYGSAGHISGWIITDKTRSLALPSTGPILGAGIDGDWKTERVAFHQGNRLLLLTDGVIEASLPEGDAYGEVRLCETLRGTISLSPDEALASLHQQLGEHMRSQECLDDVSLILVDRRKDTP